MLCEGTGSNVFCVFDGQIITPPLSSGCLAGVTRELVLEITDALEEDIAMRAFLIADEAFLTSTGRLVQPVHQIDGRSLVPGKTTARIATAFATLCAATHHPAPDPHARPARAVCAGQPACTTRFPPHPHTPPPT